MTLLDDYLCIASSKGSHHHSYLMPYLQHGHEKKMMLFGTDTSYVGRYFEHYPDTSVKFFRYTKDLSQKLLSDPEIRSKKMILNSNINREAKDFFLSPEIYHVHVCHGVRQKFIGLDLYNWFWLSDTTIVHGKKDLIKILQMRNLDTSKLDDQTFINVNSPEKQNQFILAGNIRVRQYLANKPADAAIYDHYAQLDPAKKTILYTPTYNTLSWTKDRDLCSVDFFLDAVIPNIKNLDDYNLIIKCHPNIEDDKTLVNRLNELCTQHSNISFSFRDNYLHYMQIADLLISDFSSTTYDFLYFNKPIIFLDKFNEISKPPLFEDFNNPYWFFASGKTVNSDSIKNISDMLRDELANDDYQDVRQTYKAITFDDALSINEVLNHCRKHRKYSA